MENSIDQLAQELSAWRATKKTRYERIPRELRDRALAMAGLHPRSVLIKKLGLSDKFFARVERAEQSTDTRFVRLSPPAAIPVVIRCDLEFPNGLRLRIY